MDGKKVAHGTDNPFFGRISHEPSLVESEHFRLVADRDPVLPLHYLLFPTTSYSSLADLCYSHLEAFLDLFLSTVGHRGPVWIIERGRAAFCSSSNGPVHAHAHIVLQSPQPTSVGGTVFERLEDALGAVHGRDPYLLSGLLLPTVRLELVHPFHSIEKRVARKVLASALKT